MNIWNVSSPQRRTKIPLYFAVSELTVYILTPSVSLYDSVIVAGGRVAASSNRREIALYFNTVIDL
jgi:hypothetical protein